MIVSSVLILAWKNLMEGFTLWIDVILYLCLLNSFEYLVFQNPYFFFELNTVLMDIDVFFTAVAMEGFRRFYIILN